MVQGPTQDVHVLVAALQKLRPSTRSFPRFELGSIAQLSCDVAAAARMGLDGGVSIHHATVRARTTMGAICRRC